MATYIRTQAFNSATGCYETIDSEPGNHDDLLNAELSAGDIGCKRGRHLPPATGGERPPDQRALRAGVVSAVFPQSEDSVFISDAWNGHLGRKHQLAAERAMDGARRGRFLCDSRRIAGIIRGLANASSGW